ncbi:hypothetical protein EDB81DRAFT_760662 [Dactylonectria macrodidyma]|uniref:ABC-2 type transporter transmembrane domain-containing protein n=1 Tax=Dactylonectria macrodidyma TaxID=307937 RepID=A0A9P9ERB4_9HYPO|nr:hypothetical protein EDB81DRAFT_760662 [Dactylonectria macrodidyma]
MISGFSTADVAGSIGNLFMILMFAFCGILAGPDALPGFWIFMYRVSPFTYVVEAFLGTSLANALMHCEKNELITFESPENLTCGEYLADYISEAGGYLTDPGSSKCSYCARANTHDFLSGINVSFSNIWRDFGIM